MDNANGIKAAVLDLGNVVIGIDNGRILRAWAQSANLPLDDVRELFGADERHRPLERGDITIADYHRHITGLLGRPIPLGQFLADWNALYLGPVPGIEPVLKRLRSCVRLVALTNTNDAHARVWQPMFADLLAPFERIFLSHQMRTRKPEPESYQRVLDYLHLAPREVVFVDDREVNVEAARAMGMAGIVATGAAQVAGELACLGLPVATA